MCCEKWVSKFCFWTDLYSGLVAPTLETDILVESWRNGPEPLPSSCNATYKYVCWVSDAILSGVYFNVFLHLTDIML